MGCMSCGKSRGATSGGTNIKTYSQKSYSRSRIIGGGASNYGQPKVRISFASRKKT